ncbi:SIMPL domain-containing protein [Agromyces aerolatus]|uniref:SIMPL domain-containing protein n=1 Tax=Agromyces sp. LY-1074 TaxID=3074080 RepID=UPI00286146BD|nr:MULTISPECIES: SIMPL domain-containing protein [unclassified Agromyces]MDR5699049.1 SIMPL domain-containing protein [Agromyces sp. LY-1074]MDR5705173.1 SIMPL domain-containing protein [Agromyces sp. LY-1358]
MSTQITVTGQAETRIAPELGAVTLIVTASGANRDAILQQSGGSHHELLAEVKSLDAAGTLDAWSAGQLRVWSHRPWNADGRQLPLIHEARAEVEVVFRDLARLTEWVSAVAERDSVTVGGVDWRLTDATRRRVQEDAQRRAVTDAVAKARVYADALGLGEPQPVELADRGLLGPHPGPQAPQAVMMRAAAFGGPQAPVTELTPADLVIEASVDARFSA